MRDDRMASARRRSFAGALALCLMTGLTACAGGQKQTAGGALGALAGGIGGAQVGAGSGQLWATGIGAVLGGLIGAEAGASLDHADAAYARSYSAGPGIPQQVPNRALVQRGGGADARSYATPNSAPAYNQAAPQYGRSATCRQLDGGFKPAFACQGTNGAWYVLQ